MKNKNVRVREIFDMKDAINEILKVSNEKLKSHNMYEKALFRILKITDIDARAANILKQEMLSVGADAIISEEVMLFTATKTDVLLLGRIYDYEKIYYRLKNLPFGLELIAEEIKKTLLRYDSEYTKVKSGKYEFDFNKKTYIMGILNITSDSFSDGGKYTDIDSAVKRAIEMKEEGADIIDIGAESSRPGAKPVIEEEEIERLLPVIEKIIKEVEIPISVDTYKSNTAKAVLKAGANIINDITGFKGDEKMAEVISDYGALGIIMHMKGTPLNMQDNPMYEDVTADIINDMRESIKIAEIAGILDKNIIIDPGIGFGKTLEHNIEILKRLKEFKSLGYPILVGASRKSFINKIIELPVTERVEASIGAGAAAIMNGANILRVHDVKETYRMVKIVDAIKRQE